MERPCTFNKFACDYTRKEAANALRSDISRVNNVIQYYGIEYIFSFAFMSSKLIYLILAAVTSDHS